MVRYLPMKKNQGKIIIPPGVFIDIHEKIAADYLVVNLCLDVEFILPARRKGIKTPDILMDGIEWEIKSPTGKGARTIENTLRAALRQSPYIVLDLRRMDGRIPTYKHIHNIRYQFERTRPIKRIIVITRQITHLDFQR